VLNAKTKYKPIDVTGKRLHVGDIVRVIGIPDLSDMTPTAFKDSKPVFQYLVGKYKKVWQFDKYGLAWISFKIPAGENRGLHSVGIEPCLLRARRARK
jgi:hypothetical protein